MYFQNLKAMDSSGLSDPYVKLHLLPGACKVSLHFMRVCVCVCVCVGGGGGGREVPLNGVGFLPC